MKFNNIKEKVDFLEKEGYVVGNDGEWFYMLEDDKIYVDGDSLESVVDDILFYDFMILKYTKINC